MTTKIDFETMTPYEAGMKAFELERPLWGTNQLMNCVEVAVRTAIIAERIRCQKLCKEQQQQYFEESQTDERNPYSNGYKDAAEDCSALIGDADAEDIANHDAAMASLDQVRASMDPSELESFLQNAESMFEEAAEVFDTISDESEEIEEESEIVYDADEGPIDLVEHFNNPTEPRVEPDEGAVAAQAEEIMFSDAQTIGGDKMTWDDWTNDSYQSEKIAVDDLL
jgi:hypothetical protein